MIFYAQKTDWLSGGGLDGDGVEGDTPCEQRALTRLRQIVRLTGFHCSAYQCINTNMFSFQIMS